MIENFFSLVSHHIHYKLIMHKIPWSSAEYHQRAKTFYNAIFLDKSTIHQSLDMQIKQQTNLTI